MSRLQADPLKLDKSKVVYHIPYNDCVCQSIKINNIGAGVEA